MISDQRKELVEDFVWPAVRADLIYEDRYLLGTALARPCIVRGIIEVVTKYDAGEIFSELCNLTIMFYSSSILN